MSRLAWRVAWQRQQYDRDLGLTRDLATQTPNSRDQIWNALLLFARFQNLSEAQKHSDQGKALLSEVETLYRTAIDQDPENPSVWLVYVVHLARLWHIEEAEAVIREAR